MVLRNNKNSSIQFFSQIILFFFNWINEYLFNNILRKPCWETTAMKKNSTSKNARLLSQLEEISCMLNQKNATIENKGNLTNDTIKLNTEIQSFMDDTRNELQFYLEDNNITNDTEKCLKASSYINWRGLDYVNLLLNEKENYNISCVVEKWNEKQKSFETSIDEKTKSTCNATTFNYCAILNKNDKCTRPYENNDLPVTPLLTYENLNEDIYSTTKAKLIEDRQIIFHNITNDISDYYYRMYENNNSTLNCGKWSMYIYKRGKQFIKMAANELYEDAIYVNDTITRWNQHSIQLETTVLEDTKNQCNMTKFIYQIKEQENSNNPYDLSWLLSKKNHKQPNENTYNTSALPDNVQPTTVAPNVLDNDTTTGSLGGNTTSVNNVNGRNSSENILASDTSVPSVTTDQIDLEASTTISPIDSTESNSLIPNNVIPSITNTISQTTSYAPSPDTAISPTIKILPPHSTITTSTDEFTMLLSSSTPTVNASLNDYASSSISNTTGISINTELHTNSITPSKTYTSHPKTSSLPFNETETSVNEIISTRGYKSVTNDTESPIIKPLPSLEVEPSLRTITGTPTDSSTPPLTSSTPMITTLPTTSNSLFPTDNTEHSTSTIDSAINGQISSSSFNATDSSTNIESSASNTTNSAATSSFSPENKPSATTSSISSKTIASIIHDSPRDDMNTSTINYESKNRPEASIITPKPSMPGVVNPTSITESFKDRSIQPTAVDTNITATSPLSDSSTPFSTNTNEPSTNRIASPATNTTSPTSDIISPTLHSYSLDKTPILTTPTAFLPPTNNNLTSNQTDSIQLQNLQNTQAPLIQAQQYILENNTGNFSQSPNATISNNFSTPNPSNNPTDVMPTVTPKVNLLIPMVPVGIFILGIIFLLVLICKCTPIGSWIRNRKSKKKKARKKIKKITREPLLMDTNNTKNEPINNQNYSFLHHEKEIPQCDMSLKNRKDLKYKQVKKSKAHKGMYMENEKYLKYEHMKKYKPREGMHMENENKCIREAVEVSKKHENEFILREKLNENNPTNEIKDELNKNRLEENPIHVVGYIRNGTLNEEKANEINSHKEKSTCEVEKKNLGNKTTIENDVCNWNSWVDIHMNALLEYKKEEWKLNKTEFIDICLEEIQKDGENSNLKDMGNNFEMKIKEENSTDIIDKNSSILDKYKNEKWFIILKKEWKQEQEKYLEYLEEYEIEKMTEMGVNNFMLDKKKKIWKKWIEWQIEHSYEYKNQNWFIKLLEEYEKEEIHENIKEEKIDKERNNGIDKSEMKKNLERRILLDIYMMVLEECMKEEWEKEEEFYKTNIIEIKKYNDLDDETNILDKIERERSRNVISEKKKEEIEKWKREKWFIELMLEWKNDEEKYMMETNEEILVKKNKKIIIDVVLERKRNIWKKHCENICKKWKEEDNNEEWFTKLVNEYENEEKEYKSRIYENIIEKENEKTLETGESISEINKKEEGKMRKYESNNLEELYEMNNSIINKKKLKWKTLIEIYMVILEECRKEDWLLNRGKFLEICLEEFIEEDKEKYPKITENDLAIIREGEEDITTLMIEKQKLLWKKWVQRNKRMSEKWINEEWFINLKKEWGKEQEKFDELTKESEISEIEAGNNPMLEKQKRIWKQWLKKQRMWFILHSEEEWFNDILGEYEKEEEFMKGTTKNDTKKEKEIHENIVELKQEGDKEIEKYRKKEKLIQKVLIEIHMTLLEECVKEERQKEKEFFFKTMMKELKIQENLDENVIILEIKKKRSRNAILDIEKVEIEKWKKKKWFIELMLEMNNKEKKYIKDIYEDIIEKKNEKRIKNPMLEMQKIIWKKHCEDIHRRWLEKNNKEILQH